MKKQNANQVARSARHPFAKRTPRFRHYSVLAGAALGLLWPSAVHADLSDYQAAVTSEASLISYYTFDATNAADVHGTNNGTLAGTASFATGVKGFSMALSLNGSGHVDLGFVEDFTFSDQTGTVEAWVKAGNLTENGCVFANRNGGFYESRWNVNMNQNKLAIGNWNGGVYETVAIPDASTNWHHLAVVFEDLPADYYFTVYWDGVPMGTVAQTMAFYFDLPTQIGSISTWTGAPEHWNGEVDEVAFYADPLSASDILDHYQAIFIGEPPVITKHPQGGTFAPGANLLLDVTASGPDLSYQWYKGATPLGGQTANTLDLSSLSFGDAGTYSVTVSNTTTVVTSSNAVIMVEALPADLASYQSAVSSETSLISYYTFDGLIPEDVIGPNEGVLAGNSDWASGIGGGSAQGLLLAGAGHVSLGSVPDFDFADGTGTVEGWIRADWTGNPGYWPCMYANRSGGPTKWSLHLSDSKNTPAFYNGSGSSWFVLPGGAGTNWHHFATVFTNGTASFYVDGNLIQYSPMARALGTGAGTTVQLGSSAASSTSEGWIGMLDEVAFYSDALPGSSIQAHYNAYVAGEPPVITTQPAGNYYLVGQIGQLAVGATGAQLAYQWYKNGVLLPGFTNAVIGPVVVTNSFAGDYYVVITNYSGSVTSDVASVYVGNNIVNYQSTVLAESSLISYYTFDAGDPQDSLNAHNGTNVNSVAYGTGAGSVTNAALVLSGNGHVGLGRVVDFDFDDGTGTIEGWVQPDWGNPAAYNPTLFANAATNGSIWNVHVGQWKTEIGNTSSSDETLPIFSNGSWHHYAIVFDAGTVSMYWDGEPRGSFSQTLNSLPEGTTQLGSAASITTTNGWLGGLDEVAFYSDALDASDIWNHYLAMVGSASPPTLGYSRSGTQLTLFWPVEVAGYTLEYSSTLPGTTWTSVPGVVDNEVTVAVSADTGFFRLRK